MALALPAGMSADASWALALATDGGSADELPPSSSATSVVDFSASLLDLRCATFFQWRELCLAYLFDATGVADFEVVAALSALAAACDGPAKHTHNPVASINAERPLALIIMWQSPHLPAPESEMRPRRVSTAGQKKGIFGLDRAKAGQRRRTVARFPPHSLEFFLRFFL
jgi:hypothetical protein